MERSRNGPLVRDGVLVLPPTAAEGPTPRSWIEALEALAAAHVDGLRRVLALDGGTDPVWYAALDAFGALLASRGLPAMRLREAPTRSEAGRALCDLFDEAARVDARRRLFQAADPAPEAPPALAALQAVNAARPEALFAAVPVIDPALCSGCDACLRVCPGDVLILIKDGDGAEAYDCHPAACDACGLCGEVCAASAIELATMAKGVGSIGLRSWVCDGCGARVHMPEAAGHGHGLCPVCRQGGHHKKLFQVLP